MAFLTKISRPTPSLTKANSAPVNRPDILRGIVSVVTYTNPENGFAVLKVDSGRKRHAVTGLFPEIAEGANFIDVEMEFRGTWKRTPHGIQLDCHSFRVLSDPNYFFLCKFTKGIGAKLARLILHHFPDDFASTITDDPEKLLIVPGIGVKKLKMICESWEKHQHLQKLAEFFSTKNVQITPLRLIRIQKHFGTEAVSVLETDPYRLTNIRGIGFRTADRLARELGTDPLSEGRIRAGLLHYFLELASSDGHTLQKIPTAVNETAELLTDADANVFVEPEMVHEVLDTLIFEQAFYLEPETFQVGLIGYRKLEEEIARRVQKRTVLQELKASSSFVQKFQEHFEQKHNYSLSAQQSELLYTITSGKSRIALAGYAGTGKTTACTAALQLLCDLPGVTKKDIICCAFTGMAAARIRDITGFESKTIHSLLQFSGHSFKYDADNLLPYKIVVLDEASMVNLRLFCSLLRAVPEDSLLLMVGDPAQLPPIGAGNVFSDLVRQQYVPTITLTKIYRQSEDSVLTLFAQEIRSGSCPKESYRPGWSDYSFHRVEPKNIRALKASDVAEGVVRAARELNNSALLTAVRALAREAAHELTDVIGGFQVLTPIRSGPLGVENLNVNLQEILNPLTPNKKQTQVLSTTLRVGDKVVHLVNKDMPVMSVDEWKRTGRFRPDQNEATRVFNGSLGVVSSLDLKNDSFVVCYADRRAVRYDVSDFTDLLEHAFALTVHKSQGSQYRRVVIPMTTSHWTMLGSQWMYTAITRAIEHTTVVGQPSAYHRACTNVDDSFRQTSLALGDLREA